MLGIASVGGLSPTSAPGTFLCPDDFIALDLPPLTTRTDAAAHRVPGFDPEWRARVVGSSRAEVPLRDGGVYWQATGPRLETPAEVRYVAQHADVIGMTAASANASSRASSGWPTRRSASSTTYANGVAATELTLEEVEAGQRAHRAKLAEVLAAVIPALA